MPRFSTASFGVMISILSVSTDWKLDTRDQRKGPIVSRFLCVRLTLHGEPTSKDLERRASLVKDSSGFPLCLPVALGKLNRAG